MIHALPTTPAQTMTPAVDDELRAQAVQLEAFLFTQLLKTADTGMPSPLTEGRPSQFDSFLRQTQAAAVAQSGQTGLADAIYRSMRRTFGSAA